MRAAQRHSGVHVEVPVRLAVSSSQINGPCTTKNTLHRTLCSYAIAEHLVRKKYRLHQAGALGLGFRPFDLARRNPRGFEDTVSSKSCALTPTPSAAPPVNPSIEGSKAVNISTLYTGA